MIRGYNDNYKTVTTVSMQNNGEGAKVGLARRVSHAAGETPPCSGSCPRTPVKRRHADRVESSPIESILPTSNVCGDEIYVKSVLSKVRRAHLDIFVTVDNHFSPRQK